VDYQAADINFCISGIVYYRLHFLDTTLLVRSVMPKDHRPIVFIGSSNEGLEIAKALLSNLSGCSEPQIWTQGVFGLGQGTLSKSKKVL
jgi:predicted nucleotide-binding protein